MICYQIACSSDSTQIVSPIVGTVSTPDKDKTADRERETPAKTTLVGLAFGRPHNAYLTAGYDRMINQRGLFIHAWSLSLRESKRVRGVGNTVYMLAAKLTLHLSSSSICLAEREETKKQVRPRHGKPVLRADSGAMTTGNSRHHHGIGVEFWGI